CGHRHRQSPWGHRFFLRLRLPFSGYPGKSPESAGSYSERSGSGYTLPSGRTAVTYMLLTILQICTCTPGSSPHTSIVACGVIGPAHGIIFELIGFMAGSGSSGPRYGFLSAIRFGTLYSKASHGTSFRPFLVRE